MSALVFNLLPTTMHALYDTTLKSPWYQQLTVLGIVLLAHLALIFFWLSKPQPTMVAVNELSISFANMQMPQADIAPQPKIKPKPKPKVIEPEVPHIPEAVTQEVPPPAPATKMPPAPPMATPPSPIQLDAEPDYRADYLNNPRPPYPLVARRMGYQGKVILNVEVLPEGRTGEVKLHTGSGYDILDRAALQTVKTWKFLPAKHLGRAITQWCLVPIKFSLEEE